MTSLGVSEDQVAWGEGPGELYKVLKNGLPGCPVGC